MKELFKGYCPAIVTPFNHENRINFKEFKKLIDFQISGGARAIVFLGTTGESSTISMVEKIEIVNFAVAYVNKRVPVIVGAGTNCTKVTVENCKTFENLGADGLLLVTPYYNKCTQKGLIEHYSTVANSTNLPIILYNVPSRTGVNILPETTCALSKIKNVVGIKEASGNIEQALETIRLCGENFSVYSGDDALTLPILAIGGKGVISVVGNLMPQKMQNICDCFWEEKWDESLNIQLKLNPFIKLLFIEVNPIPIKKALNLCGFNVGKCRLPLCEMNTENVDKLKQALKALNLLKTTKI